MRITPRRQAFTLIELLVVLAVIATLLTLVSPSYFKNVDRAKEVALRKNLATLRDALDKYYADAGKYPDALEDLVSRKYLRAVPLDPLTESPRTWVAVPPLDQGKGAISDVKSGALGKSVDGTPYAQF
jgi:general secretion pathway protein G